MALRAVSLRLDHVVIECRMQDERQQAGSLGHGLSNMALLVEEFVQFEPLAHSLHVDLGAAQLLPVVVFPALLLLSPTEFARLFEHVAHQRIAAHFKVAHLGVFHVFRTQHFEPLTESPIDRVVEVAKHVAAFDFRLENRAETGLTLKLVETPLHVPDSCDKMNNDN